MISTDRSVDDDELRERQLSEILHGVLHTIARTQSTMLELCTNDKEPMISSIEENKKKALFYFFRDSRKLIIQAYILTKWANSNIQKRSSGHSVLNNTHDKLKRAQMNSIMEQMLPFSVQVFHKKSLSLLSNTDLNFAIDFLSNPTIRVLDDINVPPEKRARPSKEEVDDVVGFIERTIQWRLFYNTKFPPDTFNKITLEKGILTLVVDDEYKLCLSVTGPSIETDTWSLIDFKYIIQAYNGFPSKEEFDAVKEILADKKDADEVFIKTHKKIST